jgi:Holliday junction resolvasome RuvABC ATP-dependent DNA helicase subunit
MEKSAKLLMSNDPSLRYVKLIGQEEAVTRLKAFTGLFALSGTTPGHILLTGDVGMGQSTIAMTVANERGVGFQQTSSTSIEQPNYLTAILTNLREGQVLFLSDIQLLRKPFSDRLYSALRDSKLTISIGQGPAMRNHVMEIKPFTLIATCPRKSDCPTDLISEFSLILSLKPYSMDELHALAMSIGKGTGISLEPKAAELVARASDGRPGHIASTLRRLSKAINKTEVTEEDVSRAFAAFGITVRSDRSPDGVGSVRDLSGIDFERLITGLLAQMGFHAEMTRTTGDGGIDIIATLDKPIVGGRYLFQCKRFTPENMVGAPTVRDFYGAVTADRAVKGIFITTSSFTPQAREFAEKAGVELIDLRQLEKLFLEYGVAALEDE